MAPQATESLELFYSYSHKDEELRDQLEEHLAMLKREGVIKGWHDRRISGGREWVGKIDEHLNSADIILLLISSAFLASDYCYDIEVKRAMERHEAGEARVTPVILRACDWHSAPFGKLQAFPKDGKPVKQWPDQDVAFLEIAKGIRHVAEEISAKKGTKEEIQPELAKPDPYLLIPDLRVSFVQRRDNSGNDIVKLLQDELALHGPRLVALWGAGGVGKTAIAAEAVRGLIESFADQIVWVSADGLESFSVTTLLDGVASQLGHADLRKLSLELKKGQVRDLVKTAPTLIVLDNFETIEASGRARCVDWLANPAPCSALITTRDVIGAARNIPIEVMRPEEAHGLLNQLIAQAHDARAFAKLDRDRLIQTAEANPLVLQWIVGQIDLAQDPDEVLDELRHGEGSAAARVFNRSFELRQLDNGGRAVLLALSLFAPSATRRALAEVSGLGKDNDKKKFRDAVKSLSALWLIHTTDESQRLAVEGLTRELTKARLDADPRGKTFPPRFVSRFLRYAEAHAEPTREDYNTLELEKDNLLTATDLAFSQGDERSLRRLASVLVIPPNGVLDVRGYWDEALRISGLALKIASSSRSEMGIAVWSHNVAVIHQRRGELNEAQRLYDESLTIAQRLGNRRGIADTLHQLAVVAQDQGKLDEARRLNNESLEINRKLGRQIAIAGGLHNLGVIAHDKGELDEARRLYDESLEIVRKLGDQISIANTLHSLAILSQDQGEFEEARRLYDESLEIKKPLGNQSGIASTLCALGTLAYERGKLDDARRLFDESLEIFKKLGNPSAIAFCLHHLGKLHLAEEDCDSAERLLRESMDILRKLGDKVNCAECIESIGKLRVAQGQLAAAEALYVEALEIAETLGIQFRIGSVKHSLGLLAEKQSDKTKAAQLLREALTIFEKLRSPKADDARRDLERIEGKSS